MNDNIGGPRGYPGRAGVHVRGKSQYAPRLHDHYYACTSVSDGEICTFWTYNTAKVVRHVRRHAGHVVERVEMDVLTQPPGIVHGDAR